MKPALWVTIVTIDTKIGWGINLKNGYGTELVRKCNTTAHSYTHDAKVGNE